MRSNDRFKRPAVKPVNENIQHRELRVVYEDEQMGVMSRRDALNLAKERGLDLVVITDSSNPPVAKILDAGKYFYDQKRREKELAKKRRESQIEIKEVQFRPGIDTHDFETKIRHIEKFLDKGANVRCQLRFRGRENANKEIGFDIMSQIMNRLEDTEWVSEPSINGNRLTGILKRGTNV